MNKKLYDERNKYPIKGNATYLETWGADFEFFHDFAESQPSPPKENFFYSTGASGRDYNTLIEAFHDIEFPLKITMKTDPVRGLTKNIPQNVYLDYSKKPEPGMFSTHLLCQDYYDAYAVLICLEKVHQYGPFGVTILTEAMSMGKPVISTINDAYPFDIEKEKIGLVVDYYDVEGWKQALRYLLDNPDEAREMGERGLYLARHKYNYRSFRKEIIKNITPFISDKLEVSRNVR
jgi:glycosyltransferase involved in cell wall biosynthesis